MLEQILRIELDGQKPFDIVIERVETPEERRARDFAEYMKHWDRLQENPDLLSGEKKDGSDSLGMSEYFLS